SPQRPRTELEDRVAAREELQRVVRMGGRGAAVPVVVVVFLAAVVRCANVLLSAGAPQELPARTIAGQIELVDLVARVVRVPAVGGRVQSTPTAVGGQSVPCIDACLQGSLDTLLRDHLAEVGSLDPDPVARRRALSPYGPRFTTAPMEKRRGNRR